MGRVGEVGLLRLDASIIAASGDGRIVIRFVDVRHSPLRRCGQLLLKLGQTFDLVAAGVVLAKLEAASNLNGSCVPPAHHPHHLIILLLLSIVVREVDRSGLMGQRNWVWMCSASEDA